MIELLIFDADGVLFDSYDSNIAYYNAIFARVGEPPLGADEERASISDAASQLFARRAGRDTAKLARMHEVARSLDPMPFFRLFRTPFELRPFMLELKHNFRLALATNRSATVPGLIAYLALADIFEVVASVRDGVRPKPAPDILTLCLQRANVRPERAVYIGDSPIDSEAASAAGVRFVAVGHRVEHNLRIARLAELGDILARLAPGATNGTAKLRD